MTPIRCALAAVLVALPAGPAAAASLVVSVPAGVSAPAPELEVTDYAAGERGAAIARVAVPGSITLPAGDYALRLGSTDFRYGPVALDADDHAVIALGAVAIDAPAAAKPAVYFAIDPDTGAAAARIPTDGPPALVFAGDYDLVRDLATLTAPLAVAEGAVVRLVTGAVQLATPGPVQDFPYYLLEEESGETALYARAADGIVIVGPGRYRAVRADTGIVSEVVAVEAGRIADITLAGLRVVVISGDQFDYAVFGSDDWTPALSATTGPEQQAIVPGTYGIAARSDIGTRGETALREAPRFVATAGTTTAFWVREGQPFVAAAGGGEVPIRVLTPYGDWIPIGWPVTLAVTVAEPSSVALALADAATGEELAALGTFDIEPPTAEVPVTLPEAVADATLVRVVATAEAQGQAFVGQSAAYLAVLPGAEPIAAPSLVETSATTVTISWAPAGEVLGYNIYRTPIGERPLNGDIPFPGTSFRDIGLEADREYSYRVCGVDERGLEGPCSPELVTRTNGR